MAVIYPNVCYENCIDYNDFIKKLDDGEYLENKGQWVFRGQMDAGWELVTSIERAFKNFGVIFSKKDQVENNMIREFRRRAHHYLTNIPSEKANDELMALMQHHGAPTRLLDFTYSPYVAAYFAFEAALKNSKVGIWAFNTTWHKDKLYKNYSHLWTSLESYREYRKPEDFNSIFKSNQHYRLALAVNPFHLNERLAYQRGVFVCPGDVRVKFMKNLVDFGGDCGKTKPVAEFIIPTGKNGEIRDKALNQLDLMNINRITLFPGLDGFAQSFAARIPSLFIHQGDYGVR